MSEAHAVAVERVVARLPYADEIRTGAARGVDTIAAQVSFDRHPRAHHVVYVPGAPHNKSLVTYMQARQATIIRLATLAKKGDTYRLRNEQMLLGADELIAFVTDRDFYRSGEWMTINIARRTGVTVRLCVLRKEVVPGPTRQ
jgi:hypothetical protein